MTQSTPSPRLALVTGANKGIGFHIARKLGAEGVHVLVGSCDAGRGEKAVATLRSEGVVADLLVLDVTSADSVASAAENYFAHDGSVYPW